MSQKIISIPYSMFEIDDRIFWIDSHFPRYLKEPFRLSALVKKEVDDSAEGEILDVEIDPKSLPIFAESLIPEIEGRLRAVRAERSKKMGRWSLSRLLLIPVGHSRKISEDDELSRTERELAVSIEILKKISKSRYCNKTGYYNLKIVNGMPDDDVYSRIMQVDEGFREKIREYIQ